MRLFSNRRRPFALGPLPAEKLPRENTPKSPDVLAAPAEPSARPGTWCYSQVLEPIETLFQSFRTPESARVQAPMPSLQAAADNLKGYAFFLDADLVGICSPSFAAWLGEPSSSESFAISILVAHRRPIYRGEPGYDWIAGSEEIAANLRAAEIATVLARYIATLGFGATAHTASESALDLDRLALEAGVLEQVDGRLGHPLLSRGFGLAAVSTSLELPLDRPLAARSGPKNLRIKLSHAVGLGGTRPGWQRLGGQNRPWHLGRYPMETIPRSDKPTTLILADEVRRVPVRQNFFHRARAGDLGPRTLKEVQRFVVKAPHGRASLEVLQRLSGLRSTLR